MDKNIKFDLRTELGKITPRIAAGAKIYAFGTGGLWKYIQNLCKNLVNINIYDSIDGFIDNNASKQGSLFQGKPVMPIEDIEVNNSVVIISCAGKNRDEIFGQLQNRGFVYDHSFFIENCFFVLLMRYGYERSLQFKDKHKGQRCFVIGNGPSLLTKDLNRIKSEFSFASNRIYLMFDKTSWRPSYYSVIDNHILKHFHREIKDNIFCPIFYNYELANGIDDFSLANDYYFVQDTSYIYKPLSFAKPKFSEDPFMLYSYATVTYNSLQLAAYMGFSEIYLLGIDNSYPVMVNEKGELITDKVEGHFATDYFANMENKNIPRIDYMNLGYSAAREYCEQHGIKIRNATRGGKLEIFERVDFDDLF